MRRVVIGAAALWLAACNGGATAFDRAIWAAERGNYDGESRRSGMVAGLDDAGVTPGAPRAGVRALLGPPDSSGPAADIWFLGRSASGPSFETYRVDYDARGRVTKIAFRRD